MFIQTASALKSKQRTPWFNWSAEQHLWSFQGSQVQNYGLVFFCDVRQSCNYYEDTFHFQFMIDSYEREKYGAATGNRGLRDVTELNLAGGSTFWRTAKLCATDSADDDTKLKLVPHI